MIRADQTNRTTIRRWAWPALGVGLVLLGTGALLGRQSLDQLGRAYLIAWLFLWGIAMGSLALVMVHHLTGGAWGLLVCRILEAQMRTLPLLAVLFVPLALAAEHVYPWAADAHRASGATDSFQARYFQGPFVWGRAIGYFVLWTTLAWLLGFWSRQEDDAGVRSAWKCQGLSGPGLVIYGITLHFASIDWMMSIEAPFTSTIYGPIVAAGQLLSALTLSLVAFACIARQAEFAPAMSGKVLNDLGNLLFTLVLTWAYLVWCQAMLIWMADLRHDNTWWLARARGGWPWLSAIIAILGFVGPLFVLLFRKVKRDQNLLARTAALVLVVQFIFVTYQILPSAAPNGRIAVLPALFLALGLIATWLAAFLWLLSSRPLVPRRDRSWDHARHLQRSDLEELDREEALIHG
jgi:hypothetical protein